MLINLAVLKLYSYLCSMKKEIIKIIIKVALYALGLIAAYFGVSSMTSCSTSHNVVARGRTTIVTVDTTIMLNIAVLSALKILNPMLKINSRCFIVEVNGVQYVVKYGKIDEFLCLFLPSVVVISSMITSSVSWEHDYQWYKRI